MQTRNRTHDMNFTIPINYTLLHVDRRDTAEYIFVSNNILVVQRNIGKMVLHKLEDSMLVVDSSKLAAHIQSTTIQKVLRSFLS
jgi:hypothetical protein